MKPLLGLSVLGWVLSVVGVAAAPERLQDKTLVVWVALGDLDQRGGSALTLDDGQTHFDGIVFGEVVPRRWMPGSDFYRRTLKEQEGWAEETQADGTFRQIAVVYRGQEATVYREGQEYARYRMPNPPQAFGPEAVVLFGRRHLEATDGERSFVGRIRDARIYAQPLDSAALQALRPGERAAALEPWAWWAFGDEGLREKTGRFTEIKLIGDVRLEGGCLVLKGQGASVICTAPAEDEKDRAPVPRAWSRTGGVPEAVVRSARTLRERFLEDPYRPRYHFCVPEDMGMPGDPNGAFFAGGRYHLMYLYNRSGTGFCWGHLSSADLVHWRHHPDAIGPGAGDEGCFSGGAFLDDDGTAYLSYWMLWGAKGIGLARSEGPAFDAWRKLPANPVIRSTEWGITEVRDAEGKAALLGSADPSNLWKQDGWYYVLTGNLLVLDKVGRKPGAPLAEQGDRLYLWRSRDLERWEYRGVFYERDPAWTERSEDNMCPSYLPLPAAAEGGPPSGKHLLLFISHNLGCQYYIGEHRGERFLPERHGRMTWVDNTYFAPEALIDGRGRQIMWAWLTDNPPGEKEQGWSGVYGLPRMLWLGEDGTLRLRPVPELERLRTAERSWSQVDLKADESRILEGVAGEACELALTLQPGTAQRVGVQVRTSPAGEETTRLYYDREAKRLVFDSTRSGQHGRKVIEQAPFELGADEPLRLRVFVDRAVVEVFANDRQAIGRRVYPTRPDSRSTVVFAEGGEARFEDIRAWEMMPANPY